MCSRTLDPWNLVKYLDQGYQSTTSFADITLDNIKYGKCWDCRKFVPDTAAAVARFWKELDL